MALPFHGDKNDPHLKTQANRAMRTLSVSMALTESEDTDNEFRNNESSLTFLNDVVFSYDNTYAEDIIQEHERRNNQTHSNTASEQSIPPNSSRC